MQNVPLQKIRNRRGKSAVAVNRTTTRSEGCHDCDVLEHLHHVHNVDTDSQPPPTCEKNDNDRHQRLPIGVCALPSRRTSPGDLLHALDWVHTTRRVERRGWAMKRSERATVCAIVLISTLMPSLGSAADCDYNEFHSFQIVDGSKRCHAALRHCDGTLKGVAPTPYPAVGGECPHHSRTITATSRVAPRGTPTRSAMDETVTMMESLTRAA